MNNRFAIPDQSSLYNIKHIYNKFIEELGKNGLENVIVNPTFDLKSYIDGTMDLLGWSHNLNNIDQDFQFNIETTLCQQLRNIKPNEIYTLVVDLRNTAPLNVSFSSTENVVYDYFNQTLNPVYTIPRVEDDFGNPTRHQVSFTLTTGQILNEVVRLQFTSNLNNIVEFHNVSLVKGTFAFNIDKKYGVFTDMVRLTNTDIASFFELSTDGENYQRILTNRNWDLIASGLATNNYFYSVTQSNFRFLRKDIPDAANQLITFLDGLRSEQDVNLAQVAKLVLDGGQIEVNAAQQSGDPNESFSVTVKRGDQRDVGIRYNELIDRWQFTHDGVDWKILGSGEGGTGGTGSSELEYYAEILQQTSFAHAYYDLFEEIDQRISIINVNDKLTWVAARTLYKAEFDLNPPWWLLTKNIWDASVSGQFYRFFPHVLTNKPNNGGIIISYALAGTPDPDPLLPSLPPDHDDPSWIPIGHNEVVDLPNAINELYFRFEFADETVEFHSFGVFYGSWSASYSSYTRLREVLTIPSDQLAGAQLTVPNGGAFSYQKKALELYLNRVRLLDGTDYVEVDINTVEMLTPINAGDKVEFYEKYGYADFSESNHTIINDHISNDTTAHGLDTITTNVANLQSWTTTHLNSTTDHGLDTINTRIGGVETWQTNFVETDPVAMAALTTHNSEATAHGLNVINTRITDVETWQTNFVETDPVAMAALATHNGEVTAHGIDGISTRLLTVETWQTNFTENDSAALTELGIHAGDVDAHGIYALDDRLIDVEGALVGVNQTWQDVSASRVIGDTYRNLTTRPIEVILSASTDTGDLIFEVSQDNITWLPLMTEDYLRISAVIPKNIYYRCSVIGGLNEVISSWVELR